MASTNLERVLLWLFLLPQQPAFPSTQGKGREGQELFLHKRKGGKKSFFFSGGGLVGFFCPSEAVGLKFSFPYTHTHAQMYTLGITGQPGPTQLALYFCQGPGPPLIP